MDRKIQKMIQNLNGNPEELYKATWFWCKKEKADLLRYLESAEAEKLRNLYKNSTKSCVNCDCK